MHFRNFLKSRQKMWWFKSADAEALKRKKNYVMVILKVKLDSDKLTPELRTYQKLRLCIQAGNNANKLVARIR